MEFRNLAALRLPDSVALPTCTRCKHVWLDPRAKLELKRILPDLYEQWLKRQVRRAIDKLTCHSSQRRLEQDLFLSQGYLSRLRAGNGKPSSALVCLLFLLAQEPGRLDELRRLLADPDGEQ